jgi:hypothetical protein
MQGKNYKNELTLQGKSVKRFDINIYTIKLKGTNCIHRHLVLLRDILRLSKCVCLWLLAEIHYCHRYCNQIFFYIKDLSEIYPSIYSSWHVVDYLFNVLSGKLHLVMS